MKIAAIDLGTNSVILLILEKTSGGALIPLFQRSTITRIGYRVGQTGMIQPEAAARTLETLQEYKTVIDQFEVAQVLAGATSALRDARNSAEFIESVTHTIQLQPQIISGEEEARYVQVATRHEFPAIDGDVLVFDIGGGSTELIAYNGSKIRYMQSHNVGAVRFTDAFVSGDPMTEAEAETAREAVLGSLPGSEILPGKATGIGCGGTITTLQAVNLQLFPYDSTKIHKSVLTIRDVKKLFNLFRSRPLEARKSITGLHPKRADIIPMGALIALSVMQKFGLEQIFVSDRGLRWGMIYDFIEKMEKPAA